MCIYIYIYNYVYIVYIYIYIISLCVYTYIYTHYNAQNWGDPALAWQQNEIRILLSEKKPSMICNKCCTGLDNSIHPTSQAYGVYTMVYTQTYNLNEKTR